MQGGPAPDVAAQQGADIELEADAEQQQGDADIGHQLEQRGGGEAQRIEHEAAGQETHQGRQAQAHGGEAAEKGRQEKGRCDHDNSLYRDGRGKGREDRQCKEVIE